MYARSCMHFLQAQLQAYGGNFVDHWGRAGCSRCYKDPGEINLNDLVHHLLGAGLSRNTRCLQCNHKGVQKTSGMALGVVYRAESRCKSSGAPTGTFPKPPRGRVGPGSNPKSTTGHAPPKKPKNPGDCIGDVVQRRPSGAAHHVTSKPLLRPKGDRFWGPGRKILRRRTTVAQRSTGSLRKVGLTTTSDE